VMHDGMQYDELS